MYDTIIRRFSIPLEGHAKVAAKSIARVRATYAHELKTQMQAEGYLPLLDLEPSWWVRYLPEEDAYEVRYADQGVYYGKDDIRSWEGWLLGELIPTTRKPSKTSSTPSDLT